MNNHEFWMENFENLQNVDLSKSADQLTSVGWLRKSQTTCSAVLHQYGVVVAVITWSTDDHVQVYYYESIGAPVSIKPFHRLKFAKIFAERILKKRWPDPYEKLTMKEFEAELQFPDLAQPRLQIDITWDDDEPDL